MKNIRYIIAQNIKAERTRNNMTQEQVAKKLGIARETYNSFENGCKIDSYYMFLLSKIFNCKIDCFYLNVDTTICGNN